VTTIEPAERVLTTSGAQENPAITYYRLDRRDDALSTIFPAELAHFIPRSVGGCAAPTWTRDVPDRFDNVSFLVLPVGWIGEWHESPFPQWVVVLRGRWFIETQDGKRVQMGPGDLHWGADQDTALVDGGRGHRSGQLGSEPCTLMMIQRQFPL
jgi:hypothetical protein